MARYRYTDNFLRMLTSDQARALEDKMSLLAMRPGLMEERLDAWLFNFRKDSEKSIAISLFLETEYFDEHRITQLLSLYKVKLTQYLQDQQKSLSDVIIVTPDGNADSADSHAYKLSKEWSLPRDQFIDASKLIPDSGTDHAYVFFNDTHGSGNQFIKEFSSLIESIGAHKCFVVCISITEKAINLFRDKLNGVTIIPESPTPTIFDRPMFSAKDIEVIRLLGEKVCPPHPIGYGNCGLLVAYHFQCPNNNLPIIWANGKNNKYKGIAYPWIPLFEYKPKTKAENRKTLIKPKNESLSLEEINDAFRYCRRETVSKTRRRCYQSLLMEIEKRETTELPFLTLKIHILRQCAYEARSTFEQQKDNAQIQDVFSRIFSQPLDDYEKEAAVYLFVNWAIDYAQSVTKEVGVNKIAFLLNGGISHIGELIGLQPEKDHRTAGLLALRAKARRALATIINRRMIGDNKAKREADRLRSQALEDCERAFEFDNDPSIKHELALCLFANSATVESQNAIRGFSLLKEAYVEGAFLAGYELVRQLGIRKQHREAIELFKSMGIQEEDRRRFDHNLSLLAYSVLALYYSDKNSVEQKDYYVLACEWLKESINRDHHTALNVVDYCELLIICGYSNEDAFSSLNNLKPSSEATWDQVIEMIEEASVGNESMAGALLLGLENPNVWNRIGTVYFDFTKRYDKAIDYYERAIRLDYDNPIYHFNKARVLIIKKQDYIAGETELRVALNKKHHRYGWYRRVKKDIELLKQEIEVHR